MDFPRGTRPDLFEVAALSLSDGAYDAKFDALAQASYEAYGKEHVLDPSGVGHASCRLEDAKDAGRPYAKAYSSIDDPYGVLAAAAKGCPSGEWQMSARGFARLIRTLRHTETIPVVQVVQVDEGLEDERLS